MMRLRLLGAWTLLGLCCGVLPLVRADERRSDKKPVGDAKFVWEASAGGMAEVNFGNLAIRKATNPAVRQFAQHMVVDHTRANNQLIQIANQKKWELAPSMDREHQAQFDKLARMNGADFDRNYMEGQVKDHEKAVTLFEDASKSAEDPMLKAFASRTLPVIRDHLKMAKDMVKGRSDHER